MVNEVSSAGPGVQSNGARRATVVLSAQVTRDDAVVQRHLGEGAVPLGDAVQPAAEPLGSDTQPAATAGGGAGSGHRAAGQAARRTPTTGRPSAAHASNPPMTSTARRSPSVRRVSATRLEL